MDYIVPSFAMLGLDSIYLSTVGKLIYSRVVKNIQGEELKVNMYGAIITYVLLLFVLYKFIISKRESLQNAFILGVCIYGVFDFTNYAIFEKYSLTAALVDTLWGGVLFYLTTLVTYKILSL